MAPGIDADSVARLRLVGPRLQGLHEHLTGRASILDRGVLVQCARAHARCPCRDATVA